MPGIGGLHQRLLCVAQTADVGAGARGLNVAAVAMANKNARVLWALLSTGDRYRAPSKTASAVLRPGSPLAVKRARSAKLRVVKD